jgi:hypothetical protein
MKLAFRIVFLAFFTLVIARSSHGQFAVTVSFGPPPLPVYEQPICPEEGYLWVPGYWAWDPDDYDYYWVPGTWVLAPEHGFLWTPAWWGWERGGFLFHEGYWATEVGFYGGVNYGFGYFGSGFQGGRWDHNHFFYNRSVMNVNVVNIHNVYNTTIINNTTVVNRVSYNGGEGGIPTRPTPEEERVAQLRHIPPVVDQTRHIQAARSNPELRASRNQGKPPVAATARPGEFRGEGVVTAREAGGAYHPAPNQGHGQPANVGAAPHAGGGHASELQPHTAPTPRNTGDPKLDQKYQQQQQKLIDKQNQEHQKLQQQQEREHQQTQQRNVDQQKQQQMEQHHQLQTQQMEQRHSEQQQNLQSKQTPGKPK